jgi:nitrite reductase/ring-hydroxylating ferredoxin subunit
MNGDPLLVLRGADGGVRVMSAVCAHRGYVLGEERGNAKTFTCPFHGWSYSDEGRLLSAPEMEGTLAFEQLVSNHCLPVLRTEVWNGFVFVNMDGKAAPLAPRLKVIGAEIANHHMSDMVAVPEVEWRDNPWNWKFMHENAIEPHHTWYLHKGVHDFAPSRLAKFYDWRDDDDGAVFHPTGFVVLDGAFNAAHKCLFPVIPTLTEIERRRVMFCVVPPNLFFGAVPDCVFYYCLSPQGANLVTIRVGVLLPKDSLNVPNFDLKLKETVNGVAIYNDQDTVANLKTHQGLRSRFAPRAPFAPKERTLAQFNTWLVKRYRAYAAEIEARERRPIAQAV